MKKTTQLLLIAVLAAITSGCASPYMANRGRDSADIFTATVGVGGGAKARIGPFQAGLIANLDKAGLRNGEFFIHERKPYSRRGNPGEINLLVVGGDTSNTSETIRRRNKEFNTLNLIIPVAIVEPETSQLTPHYFTQLEVVCGLGPSIRLGFNPGELLDFLLGWFTIDIYNDDIQGKKSNNPSHHTTGSRAITQLPAAGER